MSAIHELVQENVIRGECQCGRCCDNSGHPQANQPEGHVFNMVFFKVALADPSKTEELKVKLKEVIDAHVGEFNKVNLFDGEEHNYMELGGWVGDQGTALAMMGMGQILGLWDVLTPLNMLKLNEDDPMVQQLAGIGMIALKAKK